MEEHYKHVLIATELSENSYKMLEKAFSVLKLLNGNVSVLHVVESDPVADHIYVDQDEYKRDVVTKARQSYKTLCEQHELPELKLHIKIDSPKTHAILDFANSRDCDLIIVGSHERHGIEKILSPTADVVVRISSCDVFVIRY